MGRGTTRGKGSRPQDAAMKTLGLAKAKHGGGGHTAVQEQAQ